jgi:hypothetical protein
MNMRQPRKEDDDVSREIGLVVDVVRNYGKRRTQFSGTRAGAACAFFSSPTHFQTWQIHRIIKYKHLLRISEQRGP